MEVWSLYCRAKINGGCEGWTLRENRGPHSKCWTKNVRGLFWPPWALHLYIVVKISTTTLHQCPALDSKYSSSTLCIRKMHRLWNGIAQNC